MQSGPRLVYVVTHPTTANLLLRGQLAFMKAEGFDVSVVAAPGPGLDQVREREGVRTVPVPMVRGPGGPARDALSLFHVRRALSQLRPDIVNASTPKGGLLGMLAARSLRVPVRIYLMRGLRLETETGALRRILSVTEKLASACAHEIVCVSSSLRRIYVEGGYAPVGKTTVLGHGSSNGVDVARFSRPELRKQSGALASKLGLDLDGPNVGFVGRLSRDKGIDLLLEAMRRVRASHPRARLIVIGGDLADENVDRSLTDRIAREEGVVDVGRVDDLAPYYPMMRVLAFPSRREGFPNVPLEAAAASVPAVGLHSTGVVDAIEDGVTGTLTADAAETFGAAVSAYLRDPKLRIAHGAAAKARAARSFSNSVVWRAWADEYRRLLAQRGSG